MNMWWELFTPDRLPTSSLNPMSAAQIATIILALGITAVRTKPRPT
jgi:hypothetical protein